MLVPELAATLPPDGRFESVVAVGDGGIGVITPERARELALVYLRQFGRFHPFTRDHGVPVDFDALSAEPWTVVAEPAFVGLPSDINGPSRKALGPFYLVRVQAAGRLVAIEAVSAYATDLGISDDGRIVTPPLYGNEFRTRIVSQHGTNDLITAEGAVERVYLAFGVLIAEVPRLIRMGWNYTAHSSRWHVRLAEPVQAQTTGGILSTDIIYIDVGGAFSAGLPSDETVEIRYFNTGDDLVYAFVPVVDGLTNRYVPIQPPGGGSRKSARGSPRF